MSSCIYSGYVALVFLGQWTAAYRKSAQHVSLGSRDSQTVLPNSLQKLLDIESPASNHSQKTRIGQSEWLLQNSFHRNNRKTVRRLEWTADGLAALHKVRGFTDHAVRGFTDHAVSNEASSTRLPVAELTTTSQAVSEAVPRLPVRESETKSVVAVRDPSRHQDVIKTIENHVDVKFFLVVFVGGAIFASILIGIICQVRRTAKRSDMKVEHPGFDVCKTSENEEPQKYVRKIREKEEPKKVPHLAESGQNVKLAFLWIACMLMNMHYSYCLQFSAYRQSLQEAYHLSDSTAGSVYTAMNAGALYFFVVPCWLLDRYGFAMTSAFSAALAVCSMLLLNFTLTTWWLPFCFFLFGFAQICFQVIGLVSVLSIFPEESAGTASAALVLSISLGITAHSLVFDVLCQKKWELYQQYIILYSLVTAAGGIMASMLVKKRDHPLSKGTAGVVSTANQLVGEEESLVPYVESTDSEEEDDINEICMAATKLFDQHTIMSHVSPAGANLEGPKLRYQLASLPFVFQMLVHCVDIAFGISLLGAVANAAKSVGIDEKEAPSFVAMLGVLSSSGHVFLGMTSDFAVLYSKVFTKYFFFFVAYLLYTVPLLVLVMQPKCLPACAYMIMFAWGGTTALAPGTIRAEFGAALAGRVYGILRTVLSITCTMWECIVPHSTEASFSPWFSAAAVAVSVNLVASFVMWIRSMRRGSTFSTK